MSKDSRKFDNYDMEKLQKAKSLLLEVHAYYFCAPGYARKVKRLETILAKLEALQNLN